MKALIQKSDLTVLVQSVSDGTRFGGPWGEGVENGSLVLLEIPTGEVLEDCDVSATSITVNAAKKAAKAAAVQAMADRRARIKNNASVNTLPELKALVADLITELGLS